ncbi:hypothetical protein B0T24DRAFT_625880 [Lasiosphaeria ovina]|uniref:CorA-like transporter domain-containing protein n=1 Tax=Lasiosphaeria ovina TaxID=92902 RepID=A0AAE0N8Q5_9PEZI|nr:hypothetical protein B0T24DRAFT_625880 [Lasiosphaeria ovina]
MSDDPHVYPLDLPRGQIDPDDLHWYSEELNHRAPQLFAENETICQVDLHQHSPSRPKATPTPGDPKEPATASQELSGGPCQKPRPGSDEEVKLSKQTSLSTAESLRSTLEAEQLPGSTRLFTIYRANSWSRMKITADMFRALCTSLKTFPRMLDLLRGMQYKSAPSDEHFMSCYNRIHGLAGDPSGGDTQPTPKTELSFQVCYNLRHFERHGRDLKDPWSCRQTVIYQRHEVSAAKSSWIVVQPSARWQASLDDVATGNATHPLFLHIRSLSSAIANNWEYLEYLSSLVLSYDQDAAFPKAPDKFDFDFTLHQKVQSVRKRLIHVKTILQGTLRTVLSISSLARAIRNLGCVSGVEDDAFNREMEHIMRDLEAYKSTSDELLSLSADIRSTISSVLNFRNQDLANGNSVQIHRIAEDNARETQIMNDIAKQTYKDSRAVRIATVIALIYLPANLVTVRPPMTAAPC